MRVVAWLRGLDGWEKGVLASRALFVAFVVLAAVGVLHGGLAGVGQRVLLGGAAGCLVAGFMVGYQAQQAYLESDAAATGGGG